MVKQNVESAFADEMWLEPDNVGVEDSFHYLAFSQFVVQVARILNIQRNLFKN